MQVLDGFLHHCKIIFLVATLCWRHIKEFICEPSPQPPPAQHRNNEQQSLLFSFVRKYIVNVTFFVLAIGIIDYVALPIAVAVSRFVLAYDVPSRAQSFWTWFEPLLADTCGMLSALVLLHVINLFNNFLFEDVSDVAFDHAVGGHPKDEKDRNATVANALIQAFLLLQVHFFCSLSLGTFVTAIFLVYVSLMFSRCAFDYKWRRLGWEVAQGFRYIEDHWLYFVGFGVPLAIATWMPSSFHVRSAIFLAAFPLHIVSADAYTGPTEPSWFPLRLLVSLMWLAIIANGYLRAKFSP